MARDQRVLVIDGLSETEDVLRAVLEPRGLRVDSERGSHAGRKPSTATAKPQPTLLVVHEDEYFGEPRNNSWAGVPRVIIGTARLPDLPAESGQHYLQQPFHYGDLIRAIDGLLSESAPPRSECSKPL